MPGVLLIGSTESIVAAITFAHFGDDVDGNLVFSGWFVRTYRG